MDDVSMDDLSMDEGGGEKPPSIDELLSQAAVEAIRAAAPGVTIDRHGLALEANLQMLPVDYHVALIRVGICSAYFGKALSEPAIAAAVTAVSVKWEELQKTKDDLERELKLKLELGDKERAFQVEYVGDADAEFRSYLARCCTGYRTNSTQYTAPYTAITQSSGFGKSRILKQLATYTSKGNVIRDGTTEYSMTVLYVNARNIKGSTGYPRATPALSNWLFNQTDCNALAIATKLLKAFKYARDNHDAGVEWMELFENHEVEGYFIDNSVKVKEELEAVHVNPTLEFSRDEIDNSGRSMKKSGRPSEGSNKSQEGSNGPEEKRPCTASKVPVLVVAVDEARALLGIVDILGVNAFRMLRRALSNVFKAASVKEANGLVFAVLVDTYSKVHDFVPALSHDPSSRHGLSTTTLFPPFVLTHTIDVMLQSGPKLSDFTSKERVLMNDALQVWKVLVAMGRPLWHGSAYNGVLSTWKKDLVQFASSKLLLGDPGNKAHHYNTGNLYGVAALFCRAGLRPRASDALSSRLVADFMSVLHYVSYRSDAHITSYASDPILTFGAAHIWYQLDKTPALHTYLLPQFKSMLVHGLVDTGNVGEIVARIFLLLAMDATMMGEKFTDHATQTKFVFSGQFCSVPQFLKMLLGADPEFREEKSKLELEAELPARRNQFNEWMMTWGDWEVGYSHFVDLHRAPTKEMLWRMLDRRAAGIFPRNHKGADLVIPIFTRGDASRSGSMMGTPPGEVSAILIQVKNREGADDNFPDSALRKLTPEFVYAEKKTLAKNKSSAKRSAKTAKEAGKKSGDDPSFSQTPVDKMIRLYLSLRETPSEELPAQCVVMPKVHNLRSGAAESTTHNYSLCLRGMFAEDSTNSPSLWPFLSIELTNELKALANSAWWDGISQVTSDLDERDLDEEARKRLAPVLSRDTAINVASKSLMLFSPGQPDSKG